MGHDLFGGGKGEVVVLGGDPIFMNDPPSGRRSLQYTGSHYVYCDVIR